jgi:Flp pilus assembly protein TadD
MKKGICIGIFVSLAGVALAQSGGSGKRSLNDAYGAYSNGYYDKAKTAIDKCIEYDDTKADAKTWFYRGNIYLMIEAMKSTKDSLRYKNLCDNCAEIAYDAYLQAGQIDPKVSVPTMNIKNYKEAMSYCSEMLIRDVYRALEKKNNETAYQLAKKAYNASADVSSGYWAGYASERANKKDEAKTYYAACLKMKDTASIYTYINLANLYREENDTAKAAKVMQDGMPVFLQEDTAHFDVNYAVAYSIIMAWVGRSEEGNKIMDRALQKDPTNYILLINYGSNLIGSKNYQEAEYYLNRALSLQPNDVFANYNMGNCFYNMSVDKSKELDNIPIDNSALYDSTKAEADALLEKARPYLEKAHELDPKDTNTLTMLRNVYARSGATDKLNEVNEKLRGGNQK